MPFLRINDCNYYYEIHGQGEQTILFSHGLLWSGRMFRHQVDYFKSRYRVVTYDHRGQGRSEVTEGGYDIDSLYEDAVALIEDLKLAPVHFAGLSMGGFVGQRLAARRPDLVRSLTLMETSALPEPFTLKYTLLNTIVRFFGVSIVAPAVMDIMFGKTFLQDPSRKAERIELEKELRSNNKSIVKAVEGVISRKGVADELPNIHCPTLILVGDEDKATVPEKSEYMHQNIAGSELVYIKGAGHTSSLEEPGQVNKAMEAFLKKCS